LGLRYLVLLYQLKAYNEKITLSVRGSKATRGLAWPKGGLSWRHGRRLLVRQTFVPLQNPVGHIYSMKREGASEDIVLLLVVTDKDGEDHCSLYVALS
jgi:hypothetical protein